MHRAKPSTRILLVGVAALLFGSSAAAQDGRVVVFRDAGFAGPAMTFTRANPDLSRAVKVRSVRVDAGKWEICERTRFRSPCVTLTQSAPLLGRPEGWRGNMLSIRPLPLAKPQPEHEPEKEQQQPPAPPGASKEEQPEAWKKPDPAPE